MFSKDGLDVNYFCQRFERHLYLKQTRIDAFVKENITFEGIYSPMIEFVTEHYVINGSKENIRVMVFTPLLLATLAVLTISAVLPVNDMRTNMSSVFIIETIIL